MASNLSLANAVIADLSYMQPVYANFCINSVESAVQAKIDQMQIGAAKCRKCSECAGKRFKTPPFANNTCSIPEGVGGSLTKTFNRASSALATLESAWEYYRDDAVQKTNYLMTKSINVHKKVSDLIGILSPFADKISFDFDHFLSKISNDFPNFAYMLMQFYFSTVNNFNDYFMNQTDSLIILSNQILKNLLILNFNNTECRDRILSDFFLYLTFYTDYWSFFTSLLLYVGDVDAELSAAYSDLSNFSIYVDSCVNGNSNLTISCLNQVREKLLIQHFWKIFN